MTLDSLPLLSNDTLFPKKVREVAMIKIKAEKPRTYYVAGVFISGVEKVLIANANPFRVDQDGASIISAGLERIPLEDIKEYVCRVSYS